MNLHPLHLSFTSLDLPRSLPLIPGDELRNELIDFLYNPCQHLS